MQCAHESNSMEGNSELKNFFSIPFYHLSIIKGFIRTESREEKPRGCLTWTSRMWWFLTQEGGLASQNLMMKEREEMDSIKLKWFTLYYEVNFLTSRPADPGPLVPCLSFSSQLKWQCLRKASLGDSRGLGRKGFPLKGKRSAPCTSITTFIVLCCCFVEYLSSSLDYSLCRGNGLADLFQCPGLSVPGTVPMGALDKTLLNE